MSAPVHDWRALNHLLDAALALPAAERADWVERLDSAHDALKPILQELLSRRDLLETGGFLHSLPKLPGDSFAGQPTVTAGELVGSYKLERMLGTGGMGSVWLAERSDGLIKRKVALKLPHFAGETGGLAERMNRERSILAALEHPHIARLYDAGIASDGRPYLALEYVEGEPIDRYCSSRSIGTRERIILIIQVARAVAYAHAHLIIHRDLKPSNILVDSEGNVRLLDFGIATLLDPAVEGSARTSEGSLTRQLGPVLTPQYASPEQIRGERVSTASDVYSLGMVLYQLLCEHLPYELDGHDQLSLAQAIASAGVQPPSAAAGDRGVRKALLGDLDTIVLRALAKAAPERYATVAELADDLERYLRGAPVRARPQSAWYHARKFIGRNKLAVAAAVAAVLALGIGLGLALWQAREARLQAFTAKVVEQFLEDIFRKNSNAQSNPVQARNTTARELLQIGAKTVDEGLKDVPASRLRVLGTLAQMHNDLQLWDEAVALDRKRLDLAHSLYGPDDPRLADIMIDTANSMQESHSNTERGALLATGLEVLDRAGEKSSTRRAHLLGELSSVYQELDPPRALRYAEDSVRILRSYPVTTFLSGSLVMQGTLLSHMHRYSEAEPVARDAIAVSKVTQGEVNAELPLLYSILADIQSARAEFALADANYLFAWQTAQSLLGDSDADTLQLQVRRGRFLVQTGRVTEGLGEAARANAAVEAMQGAADPFYGPLVWEHYGRALLEVGRAQEALQYLRLAALALRQYRPNSNGLLIVLESQALASAEVGDLQAVEPLLQEAHEIRERTADPLINLMASVEAQVAWLLVQHRGDHAAQLIAGLSLPPEDAAAGSLAQLQVALLRSEVELARGRAQSAVQLASGVSAWLDTSPQRAYLLPYEARALLDEGEALNELGRSQEAAAVLRRAVELHAKLYDPSASPLLARALIALANCLLDLGHVQEASALASRIRDVYGLNRNLAPPWRGLLEGLTARLAATPAPTRSPRLSTSETH